MSRPVVDLVARVVVERGTLRLDVTFDAPAGQVLVLLGPNGAGKTTALRALAGLAPLGGGQIKLGDQILDDAAGVFIRPEHRPIGLVHQDPLLFPHLSVRDNIGFGVRARGVSKDQTKVATDRWLRQFQLTALGDLRPRALSGGQAQRVALARTLAAEPQMLLLDEPLAALDVEARAEVRTELRRHLKSFAGPSVLVTHDPLDALTLADQLVVIEAGRIVQQGTPGDVARHPKTDFVARLVGLNLFRGTADSAGVVLLEGGGRLIVPGDLAGPVLIALRPGAIALHRNSPEGSPRNVWSGMIAGVDFVGDRVRVSVDGAPAVFADVTAAAVADLGLQPGVDIWISVKANDLEVYRSGSSPH